MPTLKRHADRAARQRAYRERAALARIRELQAKGIPPSPAVATMPGDRRWKALMAQACAALQTVRDEMDDYYSDRTETWQESDRGEMLQARIEALDDLLADISEQV